MSTKIIRFEVSVPTDEGFIGRSCKNPDCGRYFKVHIDSLREEMFCPYCGDRFSKKELTTGDQREYFTEAAVEKVKKHVYDEVDKMSARLARKSRSKYVKIKHKPIRYREKPVRPKYNEFQVDSQFFVLS